MKRLTPVEWAKEIASHPDCVHWTEMDFRNAAYNRWGLEGGDFMEEIMGAWFDAKHRIADEMAYHEKREAEQAFEEQFKHYCAQAIPRPAGVSWYGGGNVSKNDGGPAFPVPDSMPGDGVGGHGMSLRDWFAGQAIGASLEARLHNADTTETVKVVAERSAMLAYMVADAVLSAREEP